MCKKYVRGLGLPLNPALETTALVFGRFIRGSDVFIDGSDVFIPGSDVFIPGSDVFIHGPDVFFSVKSSRAETRRVNWWVRHVNTRARFDVDLMCL